MANRSSTRATGTAVVVLLLWLAAGCGDGGPSTVATGDIDSGSEVDDRGGSRRDGSVNLRDARVGDDGAAVVDRDGGGPAAGDDDAGLAGGPQIEFLEPEPASDPNGDVVLTSSTVKVRCKVTRNPDPGASEVDESSVSITLEGAGAGSTPPVNAVGDGSFEATFELSAQPNGRVVFACSARDLDPVPHLGRRTLETLLDLGPTIDLLEPPDDSSHALVLPVLVKFKVVPGVLGGGDAEATPANVTLQAAGVTIPVSESPATPGLYTASVDFNDRAVFGQAPSAASIIVSASSSRTPSAPTRTVQHDIKIDAKGPTITIDAPKDQEMVHGQVLLKVTVTDPSGVDPATVFADVNTALTLTSWSRTGNTYSQTFDTRYFPSTVTQLTINVTASDLVGNLSTMSIYVRLDNVPPLVSLDPPFVREYVDKTVGQVTTRYCTSPFDPVGDLAVSDLETIQVAAYFRAMVIDRTNYAPGANFGYIAGVDNADVALYAQGDTSLPLLVDKDGDGTCDEINSDDLPLAQQPRRQYLAPLTVRGGWYYDANNNSVTTPEHTNLACDMVVAGNSGPGVTAAQALCTYTDMFRALRAPVVSATPTPAIYALNPTNATTGQCQGDYWELGNIAAIGEGWVCLAMRAVDKIGNVGVSRPIRVCIDDGINAALCDPANDVPPTCVDGCALPPDFPPNVLYER